jgi:NAD(P)H-nitrite reductase large subunit
MLRLGEKGTIPRRDNETYAISPHLPCGLLTAKPLRRIDDVADKYKVKAVKITGATRMAIIGLKEEGIDRVWEDLNLDKGAAVGLCIRSIGTEPFKAALA